MLDMMFKAMGLDPHKTKDDVEKAMRDFQQLVAAMQRIENKLDKVIAKLYPESLTSEIQQGEFYDDPSIHRCAIEGAGHHAGNAGES